MPHANVIERDHYPDSYWSIRSALVREIRDARCWHDRVEAFEALLNTNRDAKSMAEESRHLHGGMICKSYGLSPDVQSTNAHGEKTRNCVGAAQQEKE